MSAVEEQPPVSRAELLVQTGLILTGTLNYEEVLDRILEQLKELVSHDAGSVMLIQDGTARIFRWRGYALYGDSGSLGHEFEITAIPSLQTMVETRTPVVIPWVERDPRWIESVANRWVKSYAGVPLCHQERVIGFLNLNSATPGFFETIDLALVQGLARQAALALTNARLHDQVRQEVAQRVRALKRERNFIAAVLDTAGALVLVLNRQGRIIRFNRACEQATGYPFEAVRGKLWWDLFLPPGEVEPVRADFEVLCASGRPNEREGYWLTRTGELRPVAWTQTALINAAGKVEYVLLTGIDLTELRATRAALQSSEERFRQVILSISDHVYVTRITPTGDPVNLYLSPHVERLTGYPLGAFLADWHFWPFHVIHPDDRARAAGQAARLREGESSEIEYRLVRADGETIWVRDSARSDVEGEARVIYGVVSDVTGRKQAEEALKSTNRQLQNLNDRLQRELILAQKIQRSLLPRLQPPRPSLDLAFYTAPAREVGGDFYAYQTFGAKGAIDHLAIAVGDISGKGMPAALLMAVSLTALQAVITRPVDPSALLAQLDRAVEPYTRATHQNCAMCYAVASRDSLEVANAGCITPLIRRHDGTLEWVEAGGLPLGAGIEMESHYRQISLPVWPGDLVIFSTDGVVEAMNSQREMFSFERLEQAVAGGPSNGAAVMLDYLLAEVTAFTGGTEPHDDLTIVVLQV